MHTSDVRTPQRFTVLHHIGSTIFPLILGVKVLHWLLYSENMHTTFSQLADNLPWLVM